MRDRPRWRFRISTLMLVVVVLALTFTLVGNRWRRLEREQAKARRALARVQGQLPP